MVELCAALSDAGSLSANTNPQRNPAALLESPKHAIFIAKHFCKTSNPRSKRQISAILPKNKALRFSTCWPVRYYVSFRDDPESAPVGFKAVLGPSNKKKPNAPNRHLLICNSSSRQSSALTLEANQHLWATASLSRP